MDTQTMKSTEVVGASVVLILIGCLALSATGSWSGFREVMNSPGGGAVVGLFAAFGAVGWQLRRQSQHRRDQVEMLRTIPIAEIPDWRAAFQISRVNVAFIGLAAGWVEAEGNNEPHERRRQYIDIFLTGWSAQRPNCGASVPTGAQSCPTSATTSEAQA